MKNVLNTLKVLLLFVVVFQACKDSSPKHKIKPLENSMSKKRILPQRVIPRPVLFADQPLNDSLDGLIEDSLAVYMSQAFGNDVKKSWIDGVRSKKGRDTRSIWFSIETLKSFIYAVENSIPPGDSAPKLGIRIYLAKYRPFMKSYKSLKGLDSSVADQQTVFFVGNYLSNTSGKYVNFNFNHLGSNKYQLSRIGNCSGILRI